MWNNETQMLQTQLMQLRAICGVKNDLDMTGKFGECAPVNDKG